MSRLSRCLLAHADDASRQALAAELGRQGAIVDATGVALEALERVRSDPPGLAVVGEALVGMLPLDLCRALSNKGVPVLFLGGAHIGREEALSAGAVEFLAAPAFPPDVAIAARLVCERRRDSGGDPVVHARLSDFGLYPLVRALCGMGRSALLTLERGERSAELRLCEGEATSAQIGNLTGLQALQRLLLWPEAMIEIRFVPVLRRNQIGLERGDLLAECERFLRDCAHAAAPLGSLEAVYLEDPARAAEALKTIPNQVAGLVRLFDGTRSLADVVQESPFRPFETLRVAARLVEMGALGRVAPAAAALPAAPPAALPEPSPPPATAPPAPSPALPARPSPTTRAVEDWLAGVPRAGGAGSVPRPAARPKPRRRVSAAQGRARPAPRVAAPAPASAPPAAASTPTPTPTSIATGATSEPEMSLERRIEAQLERQAASAPPRPPVDRQGMEALLAPRVGNPFGEEPPAVELPLPPGTVATPIGLRPPGVAVPLDPVPPPVTEAPAAAPAPPAAPPTEIPPPPLVFPPPALAAPVPAPAPVAEPRPAGPPAPGALPPFVVPASFLVPHPATDLTPPPEPAAPLAAPPSAPAPPTGKPVPGQAVFSALEEDFFSKVDEHGRLPEHHEVDSFDDLEHDPSGSGDPGGPRRNR